MAGIFFLPAAFASDAIPVENVQQHFEHEASLFCQSELDETSDVEHGGGYLRSLRFDLSDVTSKAHTVLHAGVFTWHGDPIVVLAAQKVGDVFVVSYIPIAANGTLLKKSGRLEMHQLRFRKPESNHLHELTGYRISK